MSGFDLSSAVAGLTPGRPLVIVDADEVVLGFLEGLEAFLASRGLYLDLTSYRLHGNIKRLSDRSTVLDVEATALLDEFRRELDTLKAVVGAREALTRLSRRASIVVLSNIAESMAPARKRNLVALGMDYPIVANSGLKGVAVKALAARVQAASFFIDDLPYHLASAAELAPDVFRIHLVASARLKELLPPAVHTHCNAEDWTSAETFITGHLKIAGVW